MKKSNVYSPLTRPELIFGIPKDAIFIFAIFLALFMIIKFFAEFSMLWLLPSGMTIYLVLFVAAKVDPFYFTISKRKGKLRTKQNSNNKGNLYVS